MRESRYRFNPFSHTLHRPTPPYTGLRPHLGAPSSGGRDLCMATVVIQPDPAVQASLVQNSDGGIKSTITSDQSWY